MRSRAFAAPAPCVDRVFKPINPMSLPPWGGVAAPHWRRASITLLDFRHKSMPGAKLRRRARSNPALAHVGQNLLGSKIFSGSAPRRLQKHRQHSAMKITKKTVGAGPSLSISRGNMISAFTASRRACVKPAALPLRPIRSSGLSNRTAVGGAHFAPRKLVRKGDDPVRWCNHLHQRRLVP